MSQPTLPPLPALKWLPPEVATILTMIFGATMTVLTSAGVTPANANAVLAALQYLIYAGIAVAGFLGHLHIHNQHVSLARAAMEINGVQSAVLSAPDAQAVTLPPPPATNAPASPSYAAPDAPQPPLADTPETVAVAADGTPGYTPATPQAATEASAT